MLLLCCLCLIKASRRLVFPEFLAVPTVFIIPYTVILSFSLSFCISYLFIYSYLSFIRLLFIFPSTLIRFFLLSRTFFPCQFPFLCLGTWPEDEIARFPEEDSCPLRVTFPYIIAAQFLKTAPPVTLFYLPFFENTAAISTITKQKTCISALHACVIESKKCEG